MKYFFIIINFFIAECLIISSVYADVWYKYEGSKKYSVNNSLCSQIYVPEKYNRIKLAKNSFAQWIRYLPVKSKDSAILTYSGDKLINNFYQVWRIIDLPLLFQQDLEQCADWGYRFWFEYQLEVGYKEDLWLTDYVGNKITYKEWSRKTVSSNYKKFFKWVCNSANSYSLKKGLYQIKEEDIMPGDIIVQNSSGGIGHVSIIFDVCENEKKGKLYLIGYSFMPAQECHIEKAENEYGINGWFTLEGYYRYLRENLNFGAPELRSFIIQDSFQLTDDAIKDWNDFEKSVKDSSISNEKATAIFPEIMKNLSKYSLQYEFKKQDKWVFPLKGYSLEYIGGNDGNGFQPDIIYGASPIKGYNFFDGNRHGGHPAHDIFVHDKNQDCIDDNTGKQIFALAMTDGIVLSIYDSWEVGSSLRGGNYVWCYHPQEKMITYYAHLKDVIVKPSQQISAGDNIGTVGRTGFSAWPPRSPTHLHLMALNEELTPYNFYNKLYNGNVKN